MIVDVETAPRCEAEDRNKRALQELDVQWGARTLDYGKLADILKGKCAGDHS